MFAQTKYIVCSNGFTEQMIIFPPTIKHETMAQVMKRARYHECVSAGFIDEFLKCYGESMTVNRKSRGELDTLMLHTMMEIDDKKLVFKDE